MKTNTFGAKNADTTAPAKTGDNANPNPPAPPAPPAPAEVTIDEIKSLITASVTDAVKAGLDDKLKDQVTPDGVKAIVDEAVAKLTHGNDTKLGAEQIKAIAEEATKKANETIRRPAKQTKDPEDAGQIEIPTGWTKGNLALHRKQLLNVLMKRDMNYGIDEADIRRGEKSGDALFAKLRDSRFGVKALTSTGSGTGDEWVPTDLGSELLRRLYLESNLAQAMLAREIEMPTNPYTLPLSTTRPTFYGKPTEGTAVTASTPGTAQPSLTAKCLQALVEYSYEIDEDAIVPILGTVQTLLGEAAAAALESALINGDVSGTHQDSDTNGITNAAEKQFTGWRKLALAITSLKVDMATGGINRANLVSLIKALGKYGKSLRDLVIVCGPRAHTDLLNLDEVVTMDKAGPRATMFTGSIASIFGIPIVVSEVNREDLNASGVYDGTTVTKGSILAVNLSRFLLGNRRGFMVETFRDIKAQANFISTSFRKAFSAMETPSATVTSVAIGYNYDA